MDPVGPPNGSVIGSRHPLTAPGIGTTPGPLGNDGRQSVDATVGDYQVMVERRDTERGLGAPFRLGGQTGAVDEDRPSLAIRPFRGSDAEVCCQVINTAIVEMDGLNEAARDHIVARNTPEQLGADLASWISFVVEAAGFGVVGAGALDGSEIKRVYVDPRAQGLGVGRVLLQILEDEATRCGLTEVQLDASPSSVTFYAAAGYKTHADGGFAIGAATFRFVTMTKIL